MQVIWCIKNEESFEINPDWLEMKKNRSGIYDTMLDAIGHFKVEMITPDELQKYIDENLSPVKKLVDDSERVKYIRELNEFNKVYRRYEESREKDGNMDFDDMVTKAIKLLDDHKAIRDEYADMYKCILVDEFQDNNYAQMQLVNRLAGHMNITAVGDDDQCIMRFQGAYSGIFTEFKEKYNSGSMAITRNYRSTENIVIVASKILDHIDDRIKKELRSEEEIGEPIKVVVTKTGRGQVEFIVKKIRELVGTKLRRMDGSESPITYRDFAILSKRRIDGQEFTRTLRSFGIPATLVGEINILASKSILDLLAFLRIADSPDTAGGDLFALLKDRGISEAGLSILANEAHRRSRRDKHSRQDYFFEILKEYDHFDIKQKKEIGEFVDQVTAIAGLKATNRVDEIVYDIMMKETGLYRRTIDSDEARRIRDRRLLDEFYGLAQEYTEIFPAGNLGDFMEAITDIGHINISVEEAAAEDSVNVLTMHKSKGKEFPFVFITDLADKRFPGSWRDIKFNIPDELLKGQKVGDLKEKYEDDERRLFYVAMTRAMNELFLLYPQRYEGNAKERKPSKFLEELDYKNNPAIEIVNFENIESEEMRTDDRRQEIKIELQKEASHAISEMNLNKAIYRIVELAMVKHFEDKNAGEFDYRRILDVSINDIDLDRKLQQEPRPLVNKDKLYLSASSINAYMDCPLRFKFQKILRVPIKSKGSLSLGSLIHSVVEAMAKDGMKDRNHGLKLIEDGITRSIFPGSTDRATMSDRAKNMLDAYLEREENNPNSLEGVEIEFRIKVGDIPLRGTIDRLERTPDGQLEVVDFKSGSTVKSKNKAVTDPQLNIYAEAVRSKYDQLPAKATLFYLEKNKSVQYDITEESVKEVMKNIKDIANNILQEKFEATPSSSACMFCSYRGICDKKV